MVGARSILDEVRELLSTREEDPERSQREADWLFRAVTGLDVASLVLDPNQAIPAESATRLRALVDRRLQGEPLQYLLGDAEFFGRTFHCDPRALIPRQETETLVEAALEKLPPEEPRLVAELGTGSGVVAISLALERPAIRLIATDILPPALELARENALLWKVADRIDLRLGDLAEPLTEPVDLLVFNPPYVPSVLIGAIQKELSYEPREALDGGADGLDTYRRLAQVWRDVVRPGGHLLLEVGAGQHLVVAEILGSEDAELWDDYRGIVRVVGIPR